MTTITLPRAVVEQALHVAENAGYPQALIKALRAALEDPQSTHSAECYQWHHKCAIAEVERLRAALAQQAEPPKASAAGHGMAWPGLASSGLARSSQTGNGGQR